ncbi:hypothetical protein Tco_1182169 [Tanacetum coccineum]
MFSVCLCARFQEDPKTSHLEAVKRIFRYIKGTTHLGLWYPKGSGIETIVYADSDHAGDYVDRKSTSGVCTFMGCCLTSWFSKKQTALAISTTEVEYVSAEKACQQALWMKQALIDYGVRLDDIPIMCDNKGAIDLIGVRGSGQGGSWVGWCIVCVVGGMHGQSTSGLSNMEGMEQGMVVYGQLVGWLGGGGWAGSCASLELLRESLNRVKVLRCTKGTYVLKFTPIVGAVVLDDDLFIINGVVDVCGVGPLSSLGIKIEGGIL